MTPLLLAAALMAAALGAPDTPPMNPPGARVPPAYRPDTPGSFVRLEPLETMDLDRARSIARQFPGGIAVRNGAKLYRMTYWTQVHDRPVLASGLISIPDDGQPPKGVVAYLHGTNTTRARAPSQPDRVDGDEESAVFAGNGYILMAPDYVGLGVSSEPQAYVVTAAQVDASLDFLRASRTALMQLDLWTPPSLFLMGFSQGGQTAAGLHRALERQAAPGYWLRGSVAIAAPYELRELLRQKLRPPASANPNNIGYVAFAAQAYATYYGHPLDGMLTPEYARALPVLFDGTKTPEEISAALPRDARRLFQPRFLANFLASDRNWFARALADNQTWRWTPVAPFRIYAGLDDTDVPPQVASVFENYARSHGGHVERYPLAGADHQASAAMAYAPALAWFDSLRAKSAPSVAPGR